jgi:hypothetical protein
MSHFSFYHLSFFFYKIREQEDGTGPLGVGSWYQWKGGSGRESVRKMKMMEKVHTHVYKCKK